MKLPPRLQIITGALTTTLAGAIGLSLFSGGQTQIGGVVLAFALIRGLLLVRQVLTLRAIAAEDDEDPARGR